MEPFVIEVSSSVVIDRPAAEVFEFVADAENNPRWQRGMRSCRWLSARPVHVGSTYRQEASFLGRFVTSTFEVTEPDPGRSITIRTLTSTFPIVVTRSVEPLPGDRARVRAFVRGDPSGAYRIAKPVLKTLVQRSVRGDYERLRRMLGEKT